MNTGDTVLHVDSGGIGIITGHSDPSGYPMVDFGNGDPAKLPPYELARVFDFKEYIHLHDVLVTAGAAKNQIEAAKLYAERRVSFSFLQKQPQDEQNLDAGLYLITMFNKKGNPTYCFAARIK